MTIVYLIRHAEPDRTVSPNSMRPLTEKGLNDVKTVTKFLQDKSISRVFSSPYKRAYDTVAPFAQGMKTKVHVVNDFREREKGENVVGDTLVEYINKQLADFSFKYPNGESLAEVQNRNVAALTEILKAHKGRNVVIGTHGIAMSTIIHFYDKQFFTKTIVPMSIEMPTPFIVKMIFDENKCIECEAINLEN